MVHRPINHGPGTPTIDPPVPDQTMSPAATPSPNPPPPSPPPPNRTPPSPVSLPEPIVASAGVAMPVADPAPPPPMPSSPVATDPPSTSARSHENSASGFGPPITLSEMIGAVSDYRRRAFLVTLGLFAAALTIVFVLPKKYESEAKMLFRLGRGSVTLDTVATTGQTMPVQESRESEMNSVVDMLQSRQLAEDVVRTVGVERVLGEPTVIDTVKNFVLGWIPKPTIDGDDAGGMTPEQIAAQEDLEAAVEELQDEVKIDSPKKSTTVTISCRAATPMLARDLTTAMVDGYKRLHLLAYAAEGSYQFFEENFNQQKDLVREYEQQMRQAKNEMGIVTIGGKQAALQQRIADLDTQLLQTQTDMAAARARLKNYQQQYDGLPEELPTSKTSGIANNAADSMRNQLFELELREKELSSKYRENHPILVTLRQQLDQSRRVVESQDGSRQQEVLANNPIRQEIQKSLLDTETQIASLESQVAGLRDSRSSTLEEMRQVNQFEIESAALQRKIETARNNQATYSQKLEEARINNALDSEAISNVSLIQPPTLMVNHVSPKRGLLLVLAGLMSILGGLFIAIVSDQWKRLAS